MNTLTQKENDPQPGGSPAKKPESAVRYIQPRVDICERADDFLIQADVPGVRKESVEVEFHAGELSIEAHREAARAPSARPSVQYRRVFTVDPMIDASKITASVDHGVLSLTLPKAESAKPRQISVS